MLRRNLFIGISNDKLKECYDSYVRVSCKRENEKELFSDLVIEYKSFIESNHPKAAEAICVETICSMRLQEDILR